jgi:hydroxybutyrate-dimer hydrolase
MTQDLRALVNAALAGAGLRTDAAAVPVEIAGDPIRRVCDGQDDLLTAGLGVVGIRGAPPGFADPSRPTAAELRRRAIHTAYRGLLDVTDAGGFGRLFGPRAARPVIPGIEYLLAVRRPDGAGITTVMLQIPQHFDAASPCLVVVASSGSRGIYGGLPTAGEWGLQRGCAVAYTDKGTGVGFFDLDTGTGYRIDLTATTDPDDPLLTFSPGPGEALAAWRRRYPHRLAVKHAHSGINPEKDWGAYVLQAAKLGLGLLNVEFPGGAEGIRFTRAGTRVIAAGVSNGGAAVLRAIEQDDEGLIDAAVASEPSAQPLPVAGLEIRQGDMAALRECGRSMFDCTTLHYLLQPAAVAAPADAASPLAALDPAQRPVWESWAAGLAQRGLVQGDSPERQARDARLQLERAGMLPEALELGAMNVQFGLWPAVAVVYANAYGRLSVESPPCDMSYAPTDENFVARALTAEERMRLAADASGVPPSAAVQIVQDLPGGEGRFASFGSLDAAACFRGLATGALPDGQALPRDLAEVSRRIGTGIGEIRMTAALRGRPVIMLHGRRDALVPVNHTSRAYYGCHLLQGESSLRYYEVEHGQHFDVFIPLLPGWSTHLVPLQPLLLDAMQRLYDHLVHLRPLPPSQVIRSTPRRMVGGQVEALDLRHLGGLAEDPGANAIILSGGSLVVPE